MNKPINSEDLIVIYQCLRELGRTERLDLLLHTYGGSVTASQQIVLLLRSYASQVNVLVPHKALSAGTLLCLGSNSIIMNPIAELSPIDPRMGIAGNTSTNSMAAISSEDIRVFKLMAESWFGLHNEEHGMNVLKLLSERIFPPSLANFFRSQQLVSTIAENLLQYHLPHADRETRQHIAYQLITGYQSHDYAITRSEAEQLGLRVYSASSEEEVLLWTIYQKCRQYLGSQLASSEQLRKHSHVDGVVASTQFVARHVVHTTHHSLETTSSMLESGQPVIVPQTRTAFWEVL